MSTRLPLPDVRPPWRPHNPPLGGMPTDPFAPPRTQSSSGCIMRPYIRPAHHFSFLYPISMWPPSSLLLVLSSFTLASRVPTLASARPTLQHRRAASATAFTDVRLTWYNPGSTSCNTIAHDNDFIVALSTQQWDGGAHCNAPVHIQYQGTTVAARVMDECPGCSVGQLDLTPGLFTHLSGSIDQGAIFGSWSFDDTDVPTGTSTVDTTSSTVGLRMTATQPTTTPDTSTTERLGDGASTTTTTDTPPPTRTSSTSPSASPIPEVTTSSTPLAAAIGEPPTSTLPLSRTTSSPTNLDGTVVSLQLSTINGTQVTVTKLVPGPSATADSSAPAPPTQAKTSAPAAQRPTSVSPPAIIGVVVGCVVFFLFILLLGLEWMRRRRKNAQQLVDLRPLSSETVLDIQPTRVQNSKARPPTMRYSTVPARTSPTTIEHQARGGGAAWPLRSLSTLVLPSRI
ncbi:hypothetical protein C8Q79DRAFT_767332 [Trametes meyenii]|nr:hypothetical protein C8Q79DRAFT_767332 [Trametes meyenii]